MTFLYRAAITITRQQPYLDWANSLDDDGPQLTAELADDRRTVYLVQESAEPPNLESLLDEFWERIFEEELAAWMLHDGDWPRPRTREMFNAWFASEFTSSVYDLIPDEPLTHADVEEADLEYTIHRCAWCDIEVDEGEARLVGFKLADRNRLAHREGLVLPLAVDEERVVIGVMSRTDSEAARAGDDVVFCACSSPCEKAIRQAVPKALRRAFKAV